jgi:hypothetical protein
VAWCSPGSSADKIFVLTVGFVLVMGVIFVYVMANVGVVLYYWRERRQDFNWILHFVFPVGTSLILRKSQNRVELLRGQPMSATVSHTLRSTPQMTDPSDDHLKESSPSNTRGLAARA